MHNNTVHASLGMVPNLLLFGRVLRIPSVAQAPIPDCLPSNLKLQVAHLIQVIRECQDLADSNLASFRKAMKLQYDKKAVDIQYEVGDLVWLYVPNLPVQMSRKLRSSWIGPFRVIQREGLLNYELRSEETTRRVRYPVHVNRLRPYLTSGLRPEEDPALRDMCREDPDLFLGNQDIPEHNYIGESEVTKEGEEVVLEGAESGSTPIQVPEVPQGEAKGVPVDRERHKIMPNNMLNPPPPMMPRPVVTCPVMPPQQAPAPSALPVPPKVSEGSAGSVPLNPESTINPGGGACHRREGSGSRASTLTLSRDS